MSAPTIRSLLTPSEIAHLAGPRSHARGLGYHDDGRTEVVRMDDGAVEAVVRGTVPYVVNLWVERGELDWSCTCPMGDDGEFCKHCVATALAATDGVPIDEGGSSTAIAVLAAPEVFENVDEPDLRAFVESLPVEDLVALVMDQAREDWRLRERLVAQAAAGAGTGIDVDTWRRRLTNAFADSGYDEHGFIDYYAAPGWARGVRDALDALDDLLGAGHADAVVVLCEHSAGLAEDAVQYIDDSDGWITDLSATVADIHLRACEQARPDPVSLATRLARLELSGDLDTFYRAATVYAEVLGPIGLDAYDDAVRSHAQASADGTLREFRIRNALVAVAVARQDPDALVAAHDGEPSGPDAHLEIARAMAAAGRHDEALAWGRRGLADASPWHARPLQDHVATMLRDRGDPAGATEIYWDAFVAAPSVDSYRTLLAEAEQDDSTPFDGWRERSVAHLQSECDDAPASGGRLRFGDTVADVLVDVLLYEGRSDDAWHAATAHGTDDRRWLTLARAREATHPVDAIAVYERQIPPLIDRKKNDAYAAAVDLMARVKTLSTDAGDPDRFTRLLADVRRIHKPKRNLMALLNRRGW